jgi:hypothetical protein
VPLIPNNVNQYRSSPLLYKCNYKYIQIKQD